MAPAKKVSRHRGVRAFWSGTISFGLVSIPVNLFPANRSRSAALRLLDEDGTPLRRRFFCPKHERDVHPEHVLRGYELENGEYVVVSDEELESVEPRKTRDIDLTRFVDQSDVPPTWFERGYYLTPAGDSTKAYRLLAETMQGCKRVGIATFVMQAKEHLVAIVGQDGLLRAHLLRFNDEVRSLDDVGLPTATKPKAALVQAYRKAIEKHATDKLDRELLRDEGVEKVRALIEKKEKQHRDVVGHEGVTGEAPEARIIDLMEVLKQSLTKDAKKAQRNSAMRHVAHRLLECARAVQEADRCK